MSSALHVSLNVFDLDRSVDFYRRLFGEPRKLKPDYAKFVAVEPELHLALQPAPLVAGRGSLSHLGIRVDSAGRVREWQAALAERGVKMEEKEREACCYALQEKFWVSDPDGNRWEFYTVLEDIEQKTDAATTCCRPNAGAPCDELERKNLPAAACC